MNNENVSGKSTGKMIGEIFLDVVTMVLLLAAFGTMYYNGFIAPNERFSVGVLSAITVVGLLILFFIGTVSCMNLKVRRNALSAGFLAFAAFQLFAMVCNWAVLLSLLCKLFTVESRPLRAIYLGTTAVIILGYIVSIFSYSNGVLDETGDGEEDADALEASEEDSDESEAAEDNEAVEEAEETEPVEEGQDAEEIADDETDADA